MKRKKPEVIGYSEELREGIFGVLDTDAEFARLLRKARNHARAVKRRKAADVDAKTPPSEPTRGFLSPEIDVAPSLRSTYTEPDEQVLRVGIENMHNAVRVDADVIDSLVDRSKSRARTIADSMLSALTETLALDSATTYVKAAVSAGFGIELEDQSELVESVFGELATLDIILARANSLSSLNDEARTYLTNTLIDKFGVTVERHLTRAAKDSALKSVANDVYGIVASRSAAKAQDQNKPTAGRGGVGHAARRTVKRRGKADAFPNP